MLRLLSVHSHLLGCADGAGQVDIMSDCSILVQRK